MNLNVDNISTFTKNKIMKKVHEESTWEFIKNRPTKLIAIIVALIIYISFMISLVINYGVIMLIASMVTISTMGIVISTIDPQRKTLIANIQSLIQTGKIDRDDLLW